jgi:uncharacterized protein (TIGR02145 family)
MKTLYTFFPFILLSFLFMVFSCSKDDDSESEPEPEVKVMDLDSNEYNTVIIGTQEWMVENLKVTQLNDTTPIDMVTQEVDWSNRVTPAYCLYNNSEFSKKTYGAIYNFHAVKTGKLCPEGWHVPSEEEWNTLMNFLGGDTIAGGKLKEEGTLHWVTPNTGADNESGFTGLPGGNRTFSGYFQYIGKYGYWWSDSDSTICACGYRMAYNSTDVYKTNYHKQSGLSVRCVKD